MKRTAGLLLLCAALLPFLLIVSLGVGSVAIPFQDVTHYLLAGDADTQHPTSVILWQLRLPRALLVVLVGATLGATGAAYQGLFRNPLADPFIIGASSGAALGATLAIASGWQAMGWGLSAVSWCAFLGTLLAVGLVSMIGGLRGAASSVSLILAGAAISTMLSAAVSFFMLMDEQSMQAIFSWLMGSFAGRGWPQVQSAWPLMTLGLIGLMLAARPLDALLLGEESAEGLGLPLARSRAVLIVVASLATAAAVSVSGIIGFVGLIAPHGARLLVGASHHRVIPLSALFGSVLLLVADGLARTLLAPVEIPVGILTAFLGGPFFLYLLGRRRESVGFEP